MWPKALRKRSKDAFNDDVALALSGCTTCWASKVMGVLHELGAAPVIDMDAALGQHVQAVTEHEVEVDAVCASLQWRMESAWEGLEVDPRVCASDGATLCAYADYFALDGKGACHLQCLALRRGQHRRLMLFRMGSADIAVNTGQYAVQEVPRAERLCHVCGRGEVEDERHAVFDCVGYTAVRRAPQFAGMFTQHYDMRALFNAADLQVTLAEFFYRREAVRAEREIATRNFVARLVVRRALAR